MTKPATTGAARGKTGLLRITADDTIRSETLPEVAHVSAVTISEDGALWAWAGPVACGGPRAGR